MPEPGPFAELIGRVAYEFAQVQPLIPTYLHLIVSALFPIYAGAHASLSRPPSAAKPDRGRRERLQDDEDAAEEEVVKMEGLSHSDAIIFPLLAGCTLAGLYFLIKWLQDPALLNRILNWYFAVFGVFSVSKLAADAMTSTHAFLFPRVYLSGGVLYRVDGKERKSVPLVHDTAGEDARATPLPGALSRIPLPRRLADWLWTLRDLPKQKFMIKAYLHRLLAVRAPFGVYGALGSVFGLTAVLFFNLVDKPWWLTNLMGFGFAYGALQIMSPTTFDTGSLILSALFFYDIYFVFYTPMMVTVARSLDIPIKLVFPRPAAPDADPLVKSHAMLGLGDVVLPGMMIGLALRFDLYLFYLRKQKTVPVHSLENTNDVVMDKTRIVKAEYVPLSGRWGESFWLRSLTGKPLRSMPDANERVKPVTFPKTYFHASIVGYIIGMLATLGVMQIFNHAQPALLYLVPGVLIALWGTALVKGEIKEMWTFSEAAEDEDAKAKENKDEANGGLKNGGVFSQEKIESRAETVENALGTNAKRNDDPPPDSDQLEPPAGTLAKLDEPADGTTKHASGPQRKNTKRASSRARARNLIYFSISRYSRSAQAQESKGSSRNATDTDLAYGSDSEEESGSRQRWKSPVRNRPDGERAGKRQRTA